MPDTVLAIDQGTSSTRAMLFDQDFNIAGTAQEEFPQHYPHSGWVEHDPEDIWHTVLQTCKSAMEQAGAGPAGIAAIGITNQRETTVIWDRRTGKAIAPAIVWQDRRTADVCQALKAAGHEHAVSAKTGLLLDPYFSATKIAWLLDHVPGARQAANRGELAFGTIDCFLLWRLTGGQTHASDVTNASRTLLYNIHDGDWDDDLCALFNVPKSLLPDVRDNAAAYGTTSAGLFGQPIAICGMAGDQQAATIGQGCFEPGMLKSTYGTGCFALLNTGRDAVASKNRLLTTIAYRFNGEVCYALEGSIFIAGAAVQWLRDGLGLIDDASQTGRLAEQADPHQDVYLVPAFTGLGAPYWDADCRGAVYGLTRNSGPAEFAKAALESVCYQTRDLLEAMRGDWNPENKTILRVDGGMVASDWTMQCLADVLNAPVDRPRILETTAIGAAYLAGFQAGIYPDPSGFAQNWALEKRFSPRMAAAERARKYGGWRDAVKRTLSRP